MIVHEGQPDLETLDRLFAIPVLTPLEYEKRYQIQSECRFASYEPGERVIGFEDETTDVFFVVRGRVQISIRSETRSNIKLGTLDAGQYFGELSTIDDRPQLASVEAVEPSLIAALPANTFHDAVLGNPVSARQLLYDLATVIRNFAARIVEVSA